MSEGHQNIEIAHVLHERNAHHHPTGGGKGVEILEILEGDPRDPCRRRA